MKRPYISRKLKREIIQEFGYRCAYCLSPEALSCNEAKGTKTVAQDPKTKEFVPLFNPRLQTWNDHFEWSESGLEVIGKTTVGRATIIALQMNQEVSWKARQRWVEAGWHPPKEEESLS